MNETETGNLIQNCQAQTGHFSWGPNCHGPGPLEEWGHGPPTAGELQLQPPAALPLSGLAEPAATLSEKEVGGAEAGG